MTCTDWIAADEHLGECGCPDGPATVIASAITTASDILYRLSGRQWPGLCSETVRPCHIARTCGCASFRECACVGADVIILPRSRVTDVTQVLVDGAVFTDFLLYAPNWLARTDDEPWPCCQDLALATTEDGTWSITYDYGAEPPEGGKLAARVLTAELVKACGSDKTCRIPTGAVSLTRRGVTYDMSAMEGRTGLPEVDMWLDSVNPKKRRRTAQVMAADDARFIPAHVTGS